MNQAHYNCIILYNKIFLCNREIFAFVSFLSASYTHIFQHEICLQIGMDQLAGTDHKYSFS